MPRFRRRTGDARRIATSANGIENRTRESRRGVAHRRGAAAAAANRSALIRTFCGSREPSMRPKNASGE